MSLAEKVIKLLSSGEWATSTLEPLFKKKVLDSVDAPSSSEPFGLVTARFYRMLTCDHHEIKYYGVTDSSIPILNPVSSVAESQVLALANVSKKKESQKQSVVGSKELLEKVSSLERLMSEAYPELFSQYIKSISSITFVETQYFGSASSPRCFGNLYIGTHIFKEQGLEELVYMIAHELGHIELFLVNTLDRLVTAKLDKSFVVAPFQGVPRPPIGRLHSCHAIYRMLWFDRKYNRFHKDQPILKSQLDETVQTLLKEECTEYGKKILHDVYLAFLRCC